MKLARFQTAHNGSTFGQLSNLRDEINRLFEWSTFPANGSDAFDSWAPALDVYEDHDNLVVTLELPGMKKEGIDISLQDNTLTISGERQNEKTYEGAQTSREERFFGRFQRSFALPKTVDSNRVRAGYKDGILTVTLPKAEDAKPRQIQVNA